MVIIKLIITMKNPWPPCWFAAAPGWIWKAWQRNDPPRACPKGLLKDALFFGGWWRYVQFQWYFLLFVNIDPYRLYQMILGDFKSNIYDLYKPMRYNIHEDECSILKNIICLHKKHCSRINSMQNPAPHPGEEMELSCDECWDCKVQHEMGRQNQGLLRWCFEGFNGIEVNWINKQKWWLNGIGHVWPLKVVI